MNIIIIRVIVSSILHFDYSNLYKVCIQNQNVVLLLKLYRNISAVNIPTRTFSHHVQSHLVFPVQLFQICRNGIGEWL